MKLLVVGDFQGIFPEKMKKEIKKEEFDVVVAVGDYAGLSDFRKYVIYRFNQMKKKLPVKSAEDFFGKKNLKRLIKKDDDSAKNVLKELDKLGKPVFLVFGNGDDRWYKYPFDGNTKMSLPKTHTHFLKGLKNTEIITYNKKRFRDFTFVGAGGYMDIDAYFNKNHFSCREENIEMMKKRVKRRERTRKRLFDILRKTSGKRILVLHYPPRGVFDIIRDKKDNPMNGQSAGIGFFSEAIKKYKPLAVFCGHMHEYRGMKKLFGVPVINSGDAEEGKYAVVEIDEQTKRVNARFSR